MPRYLRIIWIATLCMVASGNAFALGLGFYGTLQAGEADWELEDDFGPNISFDGGDITRVGLGFALDTAVLKNTLFNYRLNVGLEAFDVDLGDTNETASLGGIAIDNSFGFGVMRTEKTRLWLGPRVRVAFYGGDFDTNSDDDLWLFEFGVGGVFGANFAVGPTVVLGVETGIMFSGYAGEVENRFGFTEEFTGDSTSLFLNGVVMFRLGGGKN